MLKKSAKWRARRSSCARRCKWTNEQLVEARDDSVVECPALTLLFNDAGNCVRCDSAFYFDNGECKSCAQGYAVAADGDRLTN